MTAWREDCWDGLYNYLDKPSEGDVLYAQFTRPFEVSVWRRWFHCLHCSPVHVLSCSTAQYECARQFSSYFKSISGARTISHCDFSRSQERVRLLHSFAFNVPTGRQTHFVARSSLALCFISLRVGYLGRYRKLALKHHPDKNTEDFSDDVFVQIQEAYAQLKKRFNSQGSSSSDGSAAD